ncbi:MAG: glycosyltransferase [Prolixibacteraceae bacterium]|nr:glycosyltransferase [Prolixibacteraceae bacterium]
MAKVIILILSYNGKSLLGDCITSYLENKYSKFQIVVIDNGSTDGTKEYIESSFPQVKVLRTDINLKYSGGLNFGLKYAFDQQKSDYVLITNNDVVADKYIIQSLVDTAKSDVNAGFVIGKVYFHDKPDTFQTVGKKNDPVLWNGGHIGKGEKDTGQYDQISERDWCDDIFWLVKRELYEKTGGYDTEFAFQGEDFVTDLGGIHDKEGQSIFTARTMIAMGAKANGVIPIDTVHIDVHDLDDLEKNLILAKQLGFEGMLVLHPKELPLVHKYFSPSQKEVDWATEMLRLSDEAVALGKGVAVKDSKFIGPPMVKMAKQILRRHILIGGK